MLNWTTEPGVRVDYGQGNNYAYDIGGVAKPYGCFSPNDIVHLDDGSYRMYAHAFFSEDHPTTVIPHNITLSAVSSDLLNWSVEPGVRLDFKNGTGYETNAMFPKIIKVPGGYRALFSGYNVNQGNPGQFWLFSAISPDGLNFTVEPGKRTDFIGGETYGLHRNYPSNIITTDKGFYRVYLLTRGYAGMQRASFFLRSAISADGINWALDAGVRAFKVDGIFTGDILAEYRLYAVMLEGDGVRLFIGVINDAGTYGYRSIISLVSNDGLDFVTDTGLRMYRGQSGITVTDPVIIRIPGGYRMFYGYGNATQYPAFNTKIFSAVAYE